MTQEACLFGVVKGADGDDEEDEGDADFEKVDEETSAATADEARNVVTEKANSKSEEGISQTSEKPSDRHGHYR